MVTRSRCIEPKNNPPKISRHCFWELWLNPCIVRNLESLIDIYSRNYEDKIIDYSAIGQLLVIEKPNKTLIDPFLIL